MIDMDCKAYMIKNSGDFYPYDLYWIRQSIEKMSKNEQQDILLLKFRKRFITLLCAIFLSNFGLDSFYCKKIWLGFVKLISTCLQFICAVFLIIKTMNFEDSSILHMRGIYYVLTRVLIITIFQNFIFISRINIIKIGSLFDSNLVYDIYGLYQFFACLNLIMCIISIIISISTTKNYNVNVFNKFYKKCNGKRDSLFLLGGIQRKQLKSGKNSSQEEISNNFSQQEDIEGDELINNYVDKFLSQENNEMKLRKNKKTAKKSPIVKKVGNNLEVDEGLINKQLKANPELSSERKELLLGTDNKKLEFFQENSKKEDKKNSSIQW